MGHYSYRNGRFACNRHVNQYLLYFFLPLLLAITLPACNAQPSSDQPLDHITLQLKWLHQAQFAGFYMADEKGYYRQEGIEATLVEGGPDINMAKQVIFGKADFCIMSPDDLLIKRSQGAPLVAIAAIYRKSAVVFLSMSDSGIARPQDFSGKTIAGAASGGAAEFPIQLMALMKRLQLDTDQLHIVPYDTSYSSFLTGAVDVTPAYATAGLIKLRQQGLKLNLIWPGDYGIHFYSDLLVTTDSLLNERPELALRFLRASIQGWQDAVDDYEQAITVTMRYAPDSDPEYQTLMMEAMLPLIYTGDDYIGWMKIKTWDDMDAVLSEQGLLEKPFNVNEAYTLQLLEQIYGVTIK